MRAGAGRDLSYAGHVDGTLRKSLVRGLEWCSGKPRLLIRLARLRGRDMPKGPALVPLVLNALDVRMIVTGADHVPAAGPAIVVANHPRGLIDGAVLLATLHASRPDTKIMARATAAEVPEMRDLVIPLPFPNAPGAHDVAIEARRAARLHLAAGGLLVIFPAGRIAAAARMGGPVEEAAWSAFTVKLARQSGAVIVPVHVGGANSRLWQAVGCVSTTLRHGLMLHETARTIGGTVPIRIGAALDPGALAASHRIAAAELRAIVLDLGTKTHRQS